MCSLALARHAIVSGERPSVSLTLATAVGPAASIWKATLESQSVNLFSSIRMFYDSKRARIWDLIIVGIHVSQFDADDVHCHVTAGIGTHCVIGRGREQ